MNAPIGVYWRAAADWNSPIQQPGSGVYDGTRIAIHCWQWGSTVPGSAEQVWEQATDVGGPGTGSGWVSEHFIDDGAVLNSPTPGVLQCVPGEQPTQSTGIPQPVGPGAWTGVVTGGGNVRALPNVNSAWYATAPDGYPITIYCWTLGDWADGNYWTNLWFNASVPYDTTGLSGFINASLIAQPQPVVPECV